LVAGGRAEHLLELVVRRIASPAREQDGRLRVEEEVLLRVAPAGNPERRQQPLDTLALRLRRGHLLDSAKREEPGVAVVRPILRFARALEQGGKGIERARAPDLAEHARRPGPPGVVGRPLQEAERRLEEGLLVVERQELTEGCGRRPVAPLPERLE